MHVNGTKETFPRNNTPDNMEIREPIREKHFYKTSLWKTWDFEAQLVARKRYRRNTFTNRRFERQGIFRSGKHGILRTGMLETLLQNIALENEEF